MCGSDIRDCDEMLSDGKLITNYIAHTLCFTSIVAYWIIEYDFFMERHHYMIEF